jgi:hypothetical protein
LELRLDGRNHAWVSKPDLMDVITMEIHEPAALQIFQVNTFATF